MLRWRHMQSWDEVAHGAGARLTYQDFLSFPDDGQRHELIDGEHYVTPSPATKHQRISRELLVALDLYLHQSGLGEVFYAPFDVVLSNYDVVEPDLLVVLDHQRDIVTEQHVRGAPAIVVEILSPGTRRRDQTIKRDLYARVGVREYLAGRSAERHGHRVYADRGWRTACRAFLDARSRGRADVGAAAKVRASARQALRNRQRTPPRVRACQEISDAFGASRRPPGKARRPRIPGVFEGGATTPGGMDRRPKCVTYFLTGPKSGRASVSFDRLNAGGPPRP